METEIEKILTSKLSKERKTAALLELTRKGFRAGVLHEAKRVAEAYGAKKYRQEEQIARVASLEVK